ncbi:hypothetical protein [Thalassomonas haliotis]|uniref:Uncharacterized protein n=1 Tax=Thalassomonas haliotis TaxID=485448 RepID=A0ABY7VEL0_9GAMM|nr:hypothetical protein [Thalassomonas haliotis]WDE12001.1 hypothetical protein H3N35_00465 [Thalassomonas haliotis]
MKAISQYPILVLTGHCFLPGSKVSEHCQVNAVIGSKQLPFASLDTSFPSYKPNALRAISLFIGTEVFISSPH